MLPNCTAAPPSTAIAHAGIKHSQAPYCRRYNCAALCEYTELRVLDGLHCIQGSGNQTRDRVSCPGS
jgi:hypothetical protein